MAGLNNLLSSKDVSTTAMPGWYSTATQNVGTSLGNIQAPDIGSTAAPAAVNAFGATGPFTTGQSTLQTIGSGAANPWLTTTSPTGQTTVTPNTSTAMGGLFQAQKDYLNEILPDINATATAPAIGSGNFGSKMNLSAIGKARSQAASDLFKNQMQTALQNQQTGVSAGAALGNLGNQLVQSGLNTATYQANEPYASALNEAKILQYLQPDKTVTDQKQLSPVGQIGALASALGGTGPVSNLLSALGVQGGLSGITNILNPNNTGSPIYDTGTGTAGDQEGDFPQYGGSTIDDYLNSIDTGNDVWNSPEPNYIDFFVEE